jgi:hypothetical protein
LISQASGFQKKPDAPPTLAEAGIGWKLAS